MVFYVPIGSVGVARYCGKMYSHHLFFDGGFHLSIWRRVEEGGRRNGNQIIIVSYNLCKNWHVSFPFIITLSIAVFNRVSKVISHLLWFSFTRLYDWLVKFTPFSQPMGSQALPSHMPFPTLDAGYMFLLQF